jgi:exopolysaccharide production protein ExoZ
VPESLSQQRPVETVVTIQYLRAVAAALIAFQHAMGIPAFVYYTAHFGTVGVDLFFMISGFIMWTTTQDQNRGPGPFWLARAIRIVPMYWLFTTAYVMAALLTPASFFNLKLDPWHILMSYLFIPATHPNLGLAAPVFTLGWTLNYEAFFYVFFGLCLLIADLRVRFIVIAALFGIQTILGMWLQPAGPILSSYLDPIMLEFLSGIILAILAPYLARCGAVLGALLFVSGATWIGVVYGYEMALPRLVSHAIPSIMAVTGALMMEPWARAHQSRIGLLLGDASYSIYLIHPFAQRVFLLAVIHTIGLPSINPTVYIFSAFFIAIVAGVICYLVLERPVLRIGRKIVRYIQPTR